MTDTNGKNEAAEKYFLKSERLGFRWWTADDLPLAQQLWGDLEVTKYFGGPFSEDEIRKRFKHERARRMVHGFQYWIVELLSTGEFVGVCGLRPWRPAEEIIELGFHLLPKFWGQGLATEAARAFGSSIPANRSGSTSATRTRATAFRLLAGSPRRPWRPRWRRRPILPSSCCRPAS